MEHGKASTYNRYKCRCLPCVEAAKIARNTQRIKSGKVKNPRETKQASFCLNCSCKMIGKPNTQKYCTQTCQQEYQSNRILSDWLAGIHNGGSIFGISWTVKRYLRQLCNDKCQLCGWNTVNTHTNIVPLEVDHIDGNWENNRPENLRLICPNCHSLTENYRGRNKGNGRHTKLKAMGKSVFGG